MRKASRGLLAAGVLAAGGAHATETVEVASLTVQERLSAIEVINVTAQKAPAAEATAQLDAEVAAILAAASAAEAVEGD